LTLIIILSLREKSRWQFAQKKASKKSVFRHFAQIPARTTVRGRPKKKGAEFLGSKVFVAGIVPRISAVVKIRLVEFVHALLGEPDAKDNRNHNQNTP
jgi:hypothetical protein